MWRRSFEKGEKILLRKSYKILEEVFGSYFKIGGMWGELGGFVRSLRWRKILISKLTF